MFTRIIFLLLLVSTKLSGQQAPFRIGVAGLTHGHVNWILNRAKDGDVEIVGIAEPNRELAERLLKRYNLPLTLLYPSLVEMIAKTKPEAVTAFGSIYEHLGVVQKCAPLKIHVMVEKPLAVSLDHARQMEGLAKKHGIYLLTNYETTWYGSNQSVGELLPELGDLRKIVVHDGHMGPKEIGVGKEFLEWLTDPVQNGGGAIMDFGCYGANLATWLMKGERPISVSATTQQIKPEIYPKVDDEATLIVTYPKTQAIIQASWNWPYHRKDMEVYGVKGYTISDRNGYRVKLGPDQPEEKSNSPALQRPFNDPFAYLAAVVRGEVKVGPADLSSLPNNMIVMEILEAGKISAKEGRVVLLKK